MQQRTLDKLFPNDELTAILWKFARQIIGPGGIPVISREDLVQEGHIRILQVYKRCRREPTQLGRNRARHFLLKSAKGAMIDSIRRITRSRILKELGPKGPKFESLDAYSELDKLPTTGSNLVVRDDILSQIQTKDILNQLNQKDRQVIIERFIEKRKIKEISARHGMTIQAIRTRMKLARPALRSVLINNYT